MRRIRITREVLFLIALFVILGGMTIFLAVRNAEEEQQNLGASVPYSSRSSQGNGMLALHNWLDALGYRVQRIENQAFRIGDDVRFLFIIAPTEPIDRNEALYLLNWVERGNTLYLADNSLLARNGLLSELNLKIGNRDNDSDSLKVSQPLLDTTFGPLTGSTFWGLEPVGNDYVTYVSGNQPILIRIAHGLGTVWVTSAPSLLVNQSISDEDNAKLALGVLGNLPRGSGISFDEYHHGFKGGEGTFVNAVYNTPWGWGLLFALLLCFGYLILNGKRFGRTIPVQRTLALRTPSEYVISMANLFRRANKRGMVLQHFRHALKRRLGRAFHLNPELSDENYLEMITRMRPELDRTELARILNNLRRAETTEIDLVSSVEQSVTFGARTLKK